LSIVGHRGSSRSGWTWSGPPSGPRRPPRIPPLLPLAGAGLIALFVALALLGLWLSDSSDNSPTGANSTPAHTPAVTETPSPAAAPTPGPGGQGPLFRLAAWDGERWQFDPPLEGATYREGEGVPFLLRIDRASRGAAYSLTIRYDCEAFALLTSHDRDHGSRPALASGGPGSATADTMLAFPHEPDASADEGEAGSLSLWGGSFTGVDGPLPSAACAGENRVTVGLAAAADVLYLMWAAEISPGAAEGDAPLRLAVQAPGAEELSIEIDPESVRPVQP